MANNPNTQITMTNREKWALEGKAKQGWKCYFIDRDWIYDLQTTRDVVRETAQQIRRGATVDITHLTQMFLELYDKVGELCDCPVCYEAMTKEQTAVPMCGHLICKGCKQRVRDGLETGLMARGLGNWHVGPPPLFLFLLTLPGKP